MATADHDSVYLDDLVALRLLLVLQEEWQDPYILTYLLTTLYVRHRVERADCPGSRVEFAHTIGTFASNPSVRGDIFASSAAHLDIVVSVAMIDTADFDAALR